SDEASFEFYPDSFFIITAKQEISYTHENLISSPPWSRTGERNTDRMWTDGFGGSLHAWLNGDVATPSSDASSTSLELQPNARMGHMVFPPKPFDFEGLYGENARPFVIFRYTPAQLESLINNAETYKNDGFGVVVLWNYFYEPPCYNPPPDGQHPCYNDTTSSPEMFFPKQLDKSTSPWVPYDGIFGYEYKDPDLIKNFVRDAHRHGFKVLGYFSSPEFDPELSAPRHNGYARISHQSINDTLAFMRAFQREYNLDGWYLDNAQISRDLNLTYNFVKQVRKDIGDDGILYHHNSLDPWDGFDQVNGVGNYNGLRAVMIDAYVNYNLAGETGEIAEIDSPNDPYFRFYTSGYGITQTYSAHILATNKRSSMSVDEVNRLMAQNLHGVQRNRLSSWLNYFKPFYDEQKEKYLDGTLSFAPDWPIDSQGWFRSPTNVQITKLSPTEVQISWETDSVSDGNVTYTSNGAWWPPRGPDGSVRNDTLTTEHFVNISGLDPGTEYEFRIRSSNRAANVKDEIIWGYVGSFKISDL
ncbi:fibronectin type III domain-containing protein, partial [Candidatus Pacearchaeota archaeon]